MNPWGLVSESLRDFIQPLSLYGDGGFFYGKMCM